MGPAELRVDFRVDFRATDDGRSTTRAGRTVVADALRPVDPVGARSVEQETAWRSRYPVHFRRLVEAGLQSPDDWTAIARAGLVAAYEHLVAVADTGREEPLQALRSAIPTHGLSCVEVGGTHEPDDGFSLPYRGRRLTGDELRGQLDDWVGRGVVEPSVRDAVLTVAGHPEWLRLPGHTVAVLGAGAEMGPLTALLRWGASVAAVDLPRPDIWERVLRAAEGSAGRLLVPVRADDPGGTAGLAPRAGADILSEVPALADWLAGLEGRLVVGNYLYADGGTHVRVSAAADVLGQRIVGQRPDAALAFLATPTDVFAVPPEAVEFANACYARRSATAKALGRPLRWVSRGRLLHRAYPPAGAGTEVGLDPHTDPGIADSLVPQQGPNYALAKRIQRWRASVARQDGTAVSFHVAPSTRTRSVLKNRALAAAFEGAHRFGVEVFEPGTSNVLMAALLVHDLMGDPPAHEHPWQDEAYAAAHGGLWRTPYAPRSALGLSAVLGYAATRG